MSTIATDGSTENIVRARSGRSAQTISWTGRLDGLLFRLAICAVPLSIAASETLLAISLLFRVLSLVKGRVKFCVPNLFWFWSAWAALEFVVWLNSPAAPAGNGEMRHLLLIAAMFLMVPVLNRDGERLAVWYGVALTATFNSVVLIGWFIWKLYSYHGTLPPIIYLRSGGLLHHWMVYATVEIVVLAGLLELWHFFPEDRVWLSVAVALNGVAIILSLTRNAVDLLISVADPPFSLAPFPMDLVNTRSPVHIVFP